MLMNNGNAIKIDLFASRISNLNILHLPEDLPG